MNYWRQLRFLAWPSRGASCPISRLRVILVVVCAPLSFTSSWSFCILASFSSLEPAEIRRPLYAAINASTSARAVGCQIPAGDQDSELKQIDDQKSVYDSVELSVVLESISGDSDLTLAAVFPAPPESQWRCAPRPALLDLFHRVVGDVRKFCNWFVSKQK